MSIEDRLSATTEAVTAAMRPVRSLDLQRASSGTQASVRQASPRRRRARALRHWPGWLIPLAAAAAVIAVAATLVAVRSIAGTGPGPRPAPAATSTSSLLLASGVPRYYVALSATGTSKNGSPIRNAFLGDAQTGKQVAGFTPPSDAVFEAATASSDGRTFVLGAAVAADLGPGATSRDERSTITHIWYALQLTPGSPRHAQLARVPIAYSFTDATISGVAVSPDGRSLAVLFHTTKNDPDNAAPVDHLTLRTYSLATGQLLRTWTDPARTSSLTYGTTDLSWLDDGHTLAFTYPTAAPQQYIRTLDTASPGTNLIAASRTRFTMPGGHTCNTSPVMTADGKSVLCGTFGPNSGWCTSGELAVNAFSVATGKLERALYRFQGTCAMGSVLVVWAKSASLAVVLAVISKQTAGLPQPISGELGVAVPGKFTPLPVTLKGGEYESPYAVAF